MTHGGLVGRLFSTKEQFFNDFFTEVARYHPGP